MMKIITQIEQLYIEEGTAVAIGKFDGIHKGHRELLQKVLSHQKDGLKAAVFTFEPSPFYFLGKKEEKELTTCEEKREMFAQMGIDILVEFPMNEENAKISPDEFITDILKKRMNAKIIVAGTDLSYGYKGMGDDALLKSREKVLKYQVEIIDKVLYEGQEISSTFLREEVEKGNMELVAKLLTEPYMVSGQVVHGKKLGRTLGIPTVNLIPDKKKLLPPRGVYYSMMLWEGNQYPAITNIGYKPTVDDKQVLSVETYIFNFNENMYDKMIKVQMLAFKRGEMKFNSLNELKAQMQKDIQEGVEYFNRNVK